MDLGAHDLHRARRQVPAVPARRAIAQGAGRGRPAANCRSRRRRSRSPSGSGTAFWIERGRGAQVWLVTRPGTGMLGGMRALPDDGWSARGDGIGRGAGRRRVARRWRGAPRLHPFRHRTGRGRPCGRCCAAGGRGRVVAGRARSRRRGCRPCSPRPRGWRWQCGIRDGTRKSRRPASGEPPRSASTTRQKLRPPLLLDSCADHDARSRSNGRANQLAQPSSGICDGITMISDNEADENRDYVEHVL